MTLFHHILYSSVLSLCIKIQLVKNCSYVILFRKKLAIVPTILNTVYIFAENLDAILS